MLGYNYKNITFLYWKNTSAESVYICDSSYKTNIFYVILDSNLCAWDGVPLYTGLKGDQADVKQIWDGHLPPSGPQFLTEKQVP